MQWKASDIRNPDIIQEEIRFALKHGKTSEAKVMQTELDIINFCNDKDIGRDDLLSYILNYYIDRNYLENNNDVEFSRTAKNKEGLQYRMDVTIFKDSKANSIQRYWDKKEDKTVRKILEETGNE